MRSMSHCQARVTGSNASSPSSASAVKNWIAKNGFPPVFSCTSCAKGRTRSGAQCRASATSWPTSSSPRGASAISSTCAPALRIVKKKRERVLLAREHPEEAPEHHLEPVLRVLRRQLRDRWLFPNHELKLGNEVDDELTIRA